ncbi:hypothetical protein TSMEX_008157 [Taenia solium]|eukprot:TsM_000252600 transcript=TsM_000252600 gene=TsM_000252600
MHAISIYVSQAVLVRGTTRLFCKEEMLALLFLLFYQCEANLKCYGCEYLNWQYESALWPCDQGPELWKTLSNCTSCVKQSEVQKSDFMKPRWGQEATILRTTSRYCTTQFPPKYPDQCIFFYGSESLIEQCFCSTDYCNFTVNHKFNFPLLFCILCILKLGRWTYYSL